MDNSDDDELFGNYEEFARYYFHPSPQDGRGHEELVNEEDNSENDMESAPPPFLDYTEIPLDPEDASQVVIKIKKVSFQRQKKFHLDVRIHCSYP
jgi:hypothetical protein